MSHPRAAIRQALVDKLKTKIGDDFPTDALDRIYGSRAKPLFDQFLPAILIYARNENIIEERFATDEGRSQQDQNKGDRDEFAFRDAQN